MLHHPVVTPGSAERATLDLGDLGNDTLESRSHGARNGERRETHETERQAHQDEDSDNNHVQAFTLQLPERVALCSRTYWPLYLALIGMRRIPGYRAAKFSVSRKVKCEAERLHVQASR